MFVQGRLQYSNQILQGYNPNKRISRRPPPINPLEYQSNIYNVEILRLFDRKADVKTTILKQLTIDSINESYPEPRWLRVYTNSSKIEMQGHAGRGVYCQEFEHYMPIGAEATVFEMEVKAIEVALPNLIPRIYNFNQTGILIDSKAAT